MACEIQHKADGRLSSKEQDFVDDMVRWCAREPSQRSRRSGYAHLLQDRTTPMIEKPQKPKSQNADLANLPLALAPLCQQPHWVLWRWVRRREKWTKPPYTPTGTNAKSDDPSTWSDYPTTLNAAHRANGSFDGIGFMLRGTDLTTIDLDHCLDLKGRPDPGPQRGLKR